MLTVGIVVGAVMIGTSLRFLDGVTDPAVLEQGLTAFMIRVAVAVFLLTVLATWGMDPARSGRRIGGAPREDGVSLAQAWSLIRSSRQVLIFFSFLILFTLGLFLQDPVLESYGAQVFAMPIAATAQLNAFWGVGTLLGLLVAAIVVIPRLGKLQTARLGCRLITASLLLLLLCGLTASVPLLKVVLLLFGLAAGLATNSALCLMLDLTLPEVAGTFVGVWGLAQALSRALGKVIGGGLLDLGRLLPPVGGGTVAEAYPAFAVVLGVECIVAASALVVLDRVNVRQFREDAGARLQQVLLAESL
jgi:BCD family chlorophyll transporter-like MFS transporter